MNTQIALIHRILKLSILAIIIIVVYGCSPTLLFTSEQFPGIKSNSEIPERWRGKWNTQDKNQTFYIGKDSFSIDGLDYKIVSSKLNLGLDSANGRDKLIFQENWCYLALYRDYDSLPEMEGYQVLVGQIDQEESINCWEMTYDYFLKNQLVNQVPLNRFDHIHMTGDGHIQNLETNILYVRIPENMTKKSYHKLIKKLAINTDDYPYYCKEVFDFEFYKKVALSRTPDLILTKNGLIIKRGKNKTEIDFENISKKNKEKLYRKTVLSK